MMRIPVIVVGLGLIGTVAFARPQSVGAPRHLLAAAGDPLFDFTLLAANAHVPVGVELHENDDPQPFRHTASPRDQTVAVETVPLDDVIGAFNRAHRDYQAKLADGVIVIRPSVGRTAFLDQPSHIGSVISLTGVSSALRTIMSPLDSNLLGRAVGSVTGRGALADLTAQLTLDGSPGRTVMSTLNQVAKQRQAGWYLVTRYQTGVWTVVRFGSLDSYFGRTVVTLKTVQASAP